MYTTEKPHQRHPQQGENDPQLDEVAAAIFNIVNEETAIMVHNMTFQGGISQGSATTKHALIHTDSPLAGFIGLCSWLPKHAGNSELTRGASKTPVYLSHSLDDETISMEYGPELRDMLIAMGMQVEWDELKDGRHWINGPKGMDNTATLLRQHM